MSLDIADCESAEKAAREVHTYLNEHFEANATLQSPKETKKYTGNESEMWSVVWEGGPYEWGLNLTSGRSLCYGEFPQFTDPEITGFFESDNFSVESYYSFDILFYDK